MGPVTPCTCVLSNCSDSESALSISSSTLETSKSLAPPTSNNVKDTNVLHRSISFSDWADHKSSIFEHKAAVKLQKVYKSFRTRRKLADCAVLVEQSWWKLLDYTELKESSISFFDVEKQETAVSKWSRARKRAAKVGKGLSKNSRAKKLALQHWLEAIDPRHRYGHNLHFYYVRWLQSQSREPFFYWLDLGEGKEMNLVEKCPRSKLQQQCIKYLGPIERKAYEIELQNGKFFKKQTGEIFDTTGGHKGAKWIFVLSTSRVLYVGKKQKGSFQHSSFLAGGATLAAGQLVVENGHLRAVWPHSGHYKPTEENFNDFISFLKEHNVDLTNVQTTPVKMEISVNSSDNATYLFTRQPSSGALTLTETKVDSIGEESNADKDHELLQRLISEDQAATESVSHKVSDGYGSPEEEETSNPNPNTFVSDVDKDSLEAIHDKIIQRMSSRMELKSYQLGKQLSCTWTSGAGPRISCVRDYPLELQEHALEMVSLSPRNTSKKTKNNLYALSHATSTPLDALLIQRDSPRSPKISASLWKTNSLEILGFS